MRILVTAASSHGATAEIAQAIAMALARPTFEITVRPPDAVETVDGYDAVVLGSAIHAGRWLGPAKRLVDRDRAALMARPVWLFSSGPLGEPPMPAADPPEADAILRAIGARGHRLFAGKLDRRHLSLPERAVTAMVKAPEGDYRSWDDIRAWGLEIADELGQLPIEAGTAT
jgi:menaquinone-dependent protoporphyrinogen oxidase